MCYMSDFDWSGLDAKILRVLVTVVDTGSVTGAAQHLDVTQSAVSHQLDKLRAIVRDPLFVKSGRGIVAIRPAPRSCRQHRGLRYDHRVGVGERPVGIRRSLAQVDS